MNKLIIKDVSSFEPYEDWWLYEVEVTDLVIDGVTHCTNVFSPDNIEGILRAVLDNLEIEYRDEDEEEFNDFPELTYEKYLITVLENAGINVLFEAHDKVIEFETVGIVSMINPEYKQLSNFDEFKFAEDCYSNDFELLFNGITAKQILNYLETAKEPNFIGDKIAINALTLYKNTLSFYKLLYGQLKNEVFL